MNRAPTVAAASSYVRQAANFPIRKNGSLFFLFPEAREKYRLRLRLSLANRHIQEMNPPVFVARIREVRVGRVPSIGLLLLAASGGCALIAAARTCPSKTIAVVVPFPADTSADVTAWQMAQRLSRELRQLVMAHKRPGANGIIGAKLIDNSLDQASSRSGFECERYGKPVNNLGLTHK